MNEGTQIATGLFDFLKLISYFSQLLIFAFCIVARNFYKATKKEYNEKIDKLEKLIEATKIEHDKKLSSYKKTLKVFLNSMIKCGNIHLPFLEFQEEKITKEEKREIEKHYEKYKQNYVEFDKDGEYDIDRFNNPR